MVLKSVSQYPAKAFAGMIEGIHGIEDIITRINNKSAIPGVYKLTFTAANSHAYTAQIYGIQLAWTSDSSATTAEQQDNIIAQLALSPALAAKISMAKSSTDAVLVTELDPAGNGPAGITGLDADTALTTSTAHSNPEPMPAGILVAQGVNFQDCRLVNASGDTSSLAGVVVHQHKPMAFSSDPAALPPAGKYPAMSNIPVCKRGRIWVVVEEAVSVGDVAYVRYAAGAAGSQLGAFRKSDPGSEAASLSGKAVLRTAQATPGGLALLEINLAP